MLNTIIALAVVIALSGAADAAPKKPRPKTDGGPDLAYSCDTIRWYAARYTPAQLKAMGEQNGVKFSPKQRRQAAACFPKK